MPGRSRCQHAASGQRTTPRRVRARRSFSRARARRLRSVPGGHAEPPRRLVERQALEVAEHHRRAEGVRQPVDLAVQHLGLLAVERTLARPAAMSARRSPWCSTCSVRTLPGEPGPGPCAPCAGPRHRARCRAGRGRGAMRLARQDEEGGLEGVLGEVAVVEDAAGRRPGPSGRGARPGRRRRPRRRHRVGALNRSMSWRSESATAVPPSKSDPKWRTIEGVVRRAMLPVPLVADGCCEDADDFT